MQILLVLFSLGVVRAHIRSPGPPYNCTYCQPEQIHIAFGDKLTDIVVTWTTFNDTQESRVQYGAGAMDREARGSSVVFKDGRGQHVHRVTLTGLQYDTRYLYHCGSKYGWSDRYEFKTPPAGNNVTIRAVIFGDMGVENAHSLPYLQDESERDHFDFILHVGDFAYDMYEKDARQGDQFMRQVQPLAAIVPYMTVPGNHEEHGNFVQYKSRFSMPAHEQTESMYYSWDIGPVHFVGVNTEAYYFLNYGLRPLFEQYDWLKKDLEQANSPENRLTRPWIVLYGHRPMYCSNSDDIDCSVEYTRMGLPFLGAFSLEPLLKDYGVDIVIWAHEHSYERTWPLYDGKVYNGSVEQPYVNPGAPIHVITGSAGCREGRDHFRRSPKSWSAFRSQDFGYTRFKAFNKTHINFEQVSVDLDGKVIDSFWVIKNKNNLVGASGHGFGETALNIHEEDAASGFKPEQIHIAFGEKMNSMVIMWSTQDSNKVDSIVRYGVGSAHSEARGDSWLFVDGGPKKRGQWMHRVQLEDLEYDTSYEYYVGSEHSWSDGLSFKTPPAGEDWVVSAAIYGDLGLVNAESLPYLQKEALAGEFNFILHVGDFAYNLHDEDGTVGDRFFRQMQPVAARTPYMTCPGNHESAYNFSNYKNRFSMPGARQHDNLYYSWDIGPVHFISISTEFYYDNDTTSEYWWHSLKQQFNWIKQDLIEANRTENREQRPWIIMYGHRPMYCSSDHDECPLPDVPQRQGEGLPEPGYGLEPLLKDFGVDLAIFGHEHAYERMLPLYDHKIYNGTNGNPYINPQAPVHLVTGSAGCSEDTYPIVKKKPWTVVSSSDYGYTKFKAYNKTHLFFEQISVNQRGKVIDSFWLVREKHTAYDV